MANESCLVFLGQAIGSEEQVYLGKQETSLAFVGVFLRDRQTPLSGNVFVNG